jgi:hypothetical protein
MNGRPPTMPLAAFQDAFAHALLAPRAQADARVARLVAQPAFAVYRNTVMKSCVDALEANFPAVARLVGEAWFRAAAAEYVAGAPPREPSLLTYGDTFPAFLAGFAPAGGLPYLADVARLDRCWTESHVAADAPVVRTQDFVGADPAALADAVLEPHPAARWAFFADAPVCSIWSANRGGEAPAGELVWRGEGALLTRPDAAVDWIALDAPACRFLDACAKGRSVAAAMDAALAADGDADPARVAATLLEQGAFARLVVAPNDRTD